MYKTLLALTVSGLLAGCGGDEQSVNRTDGKPGSLSFSYPADAITRSDGSHDFTTTVPASSPIFLRFTDEVTTPEEELADSLVLEDESGNAVLLGSVMLTAGNKGIAASPQQSLRPGTTYTLKSEGLRVKGAAIKLTSDGIVFRTSPSLFGPLMGQTEDTGFEVARIIPRGGEKYPITDFSVPRIQFTEPVDEASLIYGDTISLLDPDGNLVEAQVYAKGQRVTVDPEDYLQPGVSYTLELTDGIKSALLGDSLTLDEHTSWSFTPQESASPSGTRQVMAQAATRQTGEHTITGAGINSVNLASTLLGPDNPTNATGTVFAELAYIPRFESQGESVPLRINRGALMTNDSVEVKVAGAVPAGFESEEVYVRFLSDANGFLSRNPYTDDPDAPRLVELYIDMALNTENTIANSALAQQLMHVQLVGTALVEDGQLNIEAVGVIEPGVMGLDQASGLISFRLEGFRNSSDAPAPSSVADQQAPFIKTWAPGEDHQDKMLSTDPIVLYFSEPVLPASVNEETVVLRDGSDNIINGSMSLDGSALVISPESPLNGGVDYTLTLTSGITDLASNALTETALDFQLPATNEQTPTNQSPLPLAALPGYPCAKTGGINLGEGTQGRCSGGKSTDDQLPILSHGTDRPIIIRFSQAMDPTTFNAGDTVLVEAYQEGSWTTFNDYKLEIAERELRLIPLQGWQPDTYYRYSVTSGIESQAGLPLQTQILTQGSRDIADRDFGGPTLSNVFQAVSEPETVLTPLRNMGTADVNSDLVIQAPEQGVLADGDGLFNAIANSARINLDELVPADPGADQLVTGVEIVCPPVDPEADPPAYTDCPTPNFIHMTAMLDVDVSGSADDSGRIPVSIMPSLLYTTGLHISATITDEPVIFGISPADLVGESQYLPTGPMVMRIRYRGETEHNQPVTGHIFEDDSGQLMFETELDVYLDAPYLHLDISMTDLDHNLRSFPINDITLRGPITFLDDGRMQIALENLVPLDIRAEIRGTVELVGLPVSFVGSPDIDMILNIPAGQLKLNYLSPYSVNKR